MMNKVKIRQLLWAAEKKVRAIQASIDNYRVIIKSSHPGVSRTRSEQHLTRMLGELESWKNKAAVLQQRLESSV